MTPVQLPEVPEWSKRDDLGGLVPSEIRAQLREYATEAVMVERSSRDPLIEKALRIFLNTSRAAEWLQQGGTITELMRLEKLLTPSETNSER